jgi:hypothetical protein
MLKLLTSPFAPYILGGLAALLIACGGGLYLKGRTDAANKWRPQVAELSGQITAQNAAIANLAKLSATKMADANKALDAVAEATKRMDLKASSLKSYQPKGSTVCERWEDADRAVLGALR